jgi:hypothetical protein
MRFISEKHTTLTMKRIGSVRSTRRIRNATPENLLPVHPQSYSCCSLLTPASLRIPSG